MPIYRASRHVHGCQQVPAQSLQILASCCLTAACFSARAALLASFLASASSWRCSLMRRCSASTCLADRPCSTCAGSQCPHYLNSSSYICACQMDWSTCNSGVPIGFSVAVPQASVHKSP